MTTSSTRRYHSAVPVAMICQAFPAGGRKLATNELHLDPQNCSPLHYKSPARSQFHLEPGTGTLNLSLATLLAAPEGATEGKPIRDLRGPRYATHGANLLRGSTAPSRSMQAKTTRCWQPERGRPCPRTCSKSIRLLGHRHLGAPKGAKGSDNNVAPKSGQSVMSPDFQRATGVLGPGTSKLARSGSMASIDGCPSMPVWGPEGCDRPRFWTGISPLLRN